MDTPQPDAQPARETERGGVGQVLASKETATAGYCAQAPIGKSMDDRGSGSVTVDGMPGWVGTGTTNLIFAASIVKDAQDHNVTRWTLTHK